MFTPFAFVKQATPAGSPFIVATGGTITEDGDFKIHTFDVGTSTFSVTSAGTSPNNSVEYLIVGAGGRGACSDRFQANGGGGGAGGAVRTGSFAVDIDDYTIITGAKGGFNDFGQSGAAGNLSTAFNITASGGGGGINNGPGGSNGDFVGSSPGGGGAGAGGNASGDTGGIGVVSSINGTSVTYGIGGNRSNISFPSCQNTSIGGGSVGVSIGGSCTISCATTGPGGIVIVRYKFQ
jgi:hypothetical protein